MVEVGKKYNERNLRYMRQFYEMLSQTNWNAMSFKLCWTHYREVLLIKNINAIIYYLSECEYKSLSQRQMRELIKHNTYDKLSSETKTKLIDSKELKVNDLMPNPIIIKTYILKEKISEYALNHTILNNIDDFLNQLVFVFTYVVMNIKLK